MSHKQGKRDTVGLARDASPDMMELLIQRARGGDKDAIVRVLEWGIGKPRQEIAATVQKALVMFTPEEYARMRELETEEMSLLSAGIEDGFDSMQLDSQGSIDRV